MVVRAPLAEQHLHSLDPEKHLQLNQDLLPVSKSEVQKYEDCCQVLAICIDLPCPSAVYIMKPDNVSPLEMDL